MCKLIDTVLMMKKRWRDYFASYTVAQGGTSFSKVAESLLLKTKRVQSGRGSKGPAVEPPGGGGGGGAPPEKNSDFQAHFYFRKYAFSPVKGHVLNANRDTQRSSCLNVWLLRVY